MFKLTASLALSAAMASTVSAQYLIDPAGGTVLSSPGDDDNVYNRNLGFTGHFFGAEKTSVTVAVNGQMNFSGSGSSLENAFPTNLALIAPLMNDLFIYPGSQNRVVEKRVLGQYYSVTWEAATFRFGHIEDKFQVIWFGADMTLNGVLFKADDIVFCYNKLGAPDPTWYANVGLNKGSGNVFVPTPADTDGVMSSHEIHATIPDYDATGGFILFRRVGDTYAAVTMAAPASDCPIDFNGDGFVDFFDYDDFVQAFEAGC